MLRMNGICWFLEIVFVHQVGVCVCVCVLARRWVCVDGWTGMHFRVRVHLAYAAPGF